MHRVSSSEECLYFPFVPGRSSQSLYLHSWSHPETSTYTRRAFSPTGSWAAVEPNCMWLPSSLFPEQLGAMLPSPWGLCGETHARDNIFQSLLNTSYEYQKENSPSRGDRGSLGLLIILLRGRGFRNYITFGLGNKVLYHGPC